MINKSIKTALFGVSVIVAEETLKRILSSNKNSENAANSGDINKLREEAVVQKGFAKLLLSYD